MDITDKNWCIYKHTNRINGKVYIGKTCKKPEYRWNAGKGYMFQNHFWRAICKYGWDNFDHEILMDGLSAMKATALERLLIAEYGSMDPDKGYNQTAGGEGMLGWHHTEESLEKIRQSNHKRIVSDETKIKMSLSLKEVYRHRTPTFLGRHHTEDTKAKIRDLAKNRWKDEKYRSMMLGKMRSEERSRKLSESKKKKWQDPVFRKTQLERMRSEEYRKAISERNKGRKLTPEQMQKISMRVRGEGNGMYGKHGKDNPNSIRVCQYSPDGALIARYDSIKEAAGATGGNNAAIGMCCKRMTFLSGGYIWRFEDDTDVSIPEDVLNYRRPVKQYDMNGVLLCVFQSAADAAASCGRSKYMIIDACKGKRKTAYGFIWSF